MKQHILLSTLLLGGSFAQAEIKPSALFTDNAVLQQGMDVPVWGTADDGERVTVTYAGQTVSTVTKNGRWRVELKDLQRGKPDVLTMAGTNVVTAKNVVVGEVWLCSGQSNMARTVVPPARVQPRFPYWENEAAEADYPQIRHFRTGLGALDAPADDVRGEWIICTPETVRDFTAVGYFFAKNLTAARDGVPVGLVNSSVGATGGASWLSREALAANPMLKRILDHQERVKAGYADTLAKFQADEPRLQAEYEVALTKAKAEGTKEPRKPSPPRNPFTDAYRPAGYYNSKIAPLAPYALRGVLWYQGESNSGKAGEYRALLPALITNWRELWQRPELPFLVVQLPNHKGIPPEFREAQLLISQATPHTGMIVTLDCGDADDIHPPDKRPVGARLALLARAQVYNEPVVGSGPVFDTLQIDGVRAVLTFTQVGSGLVAQDGKLTGFEIAGADKKFVPASASIEGNTVVVSSPSVSTPDRVRYAWANLPAVSLYNQEGLPASSFRTDPPK